MSLQGTLHYNLGEGGLGFVLCDTPQRIVTKSLYRTALPFSVLNAQDLQDTSIAKEEKEPSTLSTLYFVLSYEQLKNTVA